MFQKPALLAGLCVFLQAVSPAQTVTDKGNAAPVWSILSAPMVDPGTTAHVQNASILRDRINITLVDGTIQFAKPVNSVVFGAVFHGKGRVQVEPPNDIEAQQLRLFSKRDKLDMAFNDATFSFTDEFFDEIAGQVKWQSWQ